MFYLMILVTAAILLALFLPSLDLESRSVPSMLFLTLLIALLIALLLFGVIGLVKACLIWLPEKVAFILYESSKLEVL